MNIKKFMYRGIQREVIVTEEDQKSIRGYDISKIEKEDLRENWRVLTKDIDYSQMTEEQRKEEYKKTNELMKHFRHFKKDQITG